MRDINPYAPPAASTARLDQPALMLRSAATIALSSLAGAPIVMACAYALLGLGLPPWTLRTPHETIDLMAGTPMILNNLLASVICAAIVWPPIWRHHVSPARAAWIVLATCGMATVGALGLKVLGDLYAIGGTEAVLLYEVIATTAIGVILAAGFAYRGSQHHIR